ncbi:toll/interleukin-1 receptor domain-containing protein [candidate division KSB1 bacterium]|nr:toll/interleukin-1 receptor domain-containing protein [candidate division KSB1 bacterium]
MGYLPDFEYDIFISYTHLDNHAPEGEKGWVDQFHDWLESGLKRRFGSQKIEIWRDVELNGNTLFDERIKNTLKLSALFLALNSKNYLYSKYCQQEVNWFCDAAKASSFGLSVKGEQRLFHVLLNNLHYSQWPPALSGTSAFHLYNAPKDSTEPGWPIDTEDKRFREQIQDMVDAIETTLKAFPEPAAVTKPVSTSTKVKVFIANVPVSLLKTRERLVRDLEEIDESVIDPIPPPLEDTAHTEKLSLVMQETKLAIHLLDNLLGELIPNKTITYPHQQVKIGLDHPASQIVWVPKNLSLTAEPDDTGAAFIHELENNPRTKKNFTFMRSEYPEFYSVVKQKLEEINRLIQTSTEDNAILLDNHHKDQLFAFELGTYLMREGLDVVFNQESRNPVETLYNYERSLEQVRHLIIVFGMVDCNWVKQRIQKITQYMATHIDQFKIDNCWLYLVPPEKRCEELPTFPKLLKIEVVDGSHTKTFEAAVLAPVLTCCRERRNA